MQHLFQKLIVLDQNLLTAILITVFYTVEQTFKTPHKFNKRTFHLLNNIPFQILFIGINFFVASFQVWSIQKLNAQHLGLFYFTNIPYAVKIILGVACFDFIAYWTHRVSHISPLIWRLHRVHHSDVSMDSSSSFRFHPLELTFAATNVLAALVFGLDVNMLVFYYLVLLPIGFAEHSNIQFPHWMDKSFGKIFTTPNMHKIHHHRDQEYTDSNFADIFILWDRLFGTYKHIPVKQISYGLNEFDDNMKQTFWYLLTSPFKKIERIKDRTELHKELNSEKLADKKIKQNSLN